MWVVYNKRTSYLVREVATLDEAGLESSRLNGLHTCRDYAFCSRNTYYTMRKEDLSGERIHSVRHALRSPKHL